MTRYFVFSVLLFLVFSCEKATEEHDSFVIKYGSECGWCAGQEYITITPSSVVYSRNIPCGEKKGNTTKTKSFIEEDWNELAASFDYSLFLTLDYNACNVCVDGCDEIIEITKDTTVHQLRYSFSDKVEGMENLRQKLSAIMEDMRDDN